MSKAGLFSGTVTESAPADNAPTTKHKGHHWMQWGSGSLPYQSTGKRIDYDGGNYYTYSGDFFPSDTGEFTFAGFVNIPDSSPGSFFVGADGVVNFMTLDYGSWSNAGNQNIITPRLTATNGNVAYGGTSKDLDGHGLITDNWYPFLFSWSKSNAKATLYMGDTDMEVSPTENYGLALNAAQNSVINIGASTVGSLGNPFDMSQIWCASEFIDFSVEANRRLFYDSDLKPISLGIEGKIPTGRQPEYYAPDGDWSNNRGTYVDYTEVGTVGASTTSPTDDYMPKAMTFDGLTGYYNKSGVSYVSTAEVICTLALKIDAFSGGGWQCIVAAYVAPAWRLTAFVFSSDYVTAELRNKVRITAQNSAGANILNVLTAVDIADGVEHTLYVSFDASAPSLTLYVDEVDADDSGYASRQVDSGVFNTGTGELFIGSFGVSSNLYDGEIGSFGYAETYQTNPEDFQDEAAPKRPIGWKSWNDTQPLFWNEHAEMDKSIGSVGVMTKTGTITGPT